MTSQETVPNNFCAFYIRGKTHTFILRDDHSYLNKKNYSTKVPPPLKNILMSKFYVFLFFFICQVDIIIFPVIPPPGLFKVSRYERRNTEKRVNKMFNYALYPKVHGYEIIPNC